MANANGDKKKDHNLKKNVDSLRFFSRRLNRDSEKTLKQERLFIEGFSSALVLLDEIRGL